MEKIKKIIVLGWFIYATGALATTTTSPQSSVPISDHAITSEVGDKKQDKVQERDNAVFLNSIRTALINGQYDNATNLLNSYQKKFGVDDSYLMEKARFYALTNRSKEALGLTRLLLTKYPGNKTLIQINNYALNHKTSAQTKTAEESQNSQPQEAINTHVSLLEKNSNEVDVLIKKAGAVLQSTRPLQAAQAFQQAAEIKKTDASLYYRASQAYSMGEDTSNALIMIQHALAIEPKNVTYLKAQAVLADLSHNWKLLYKSYQQILQQNPEDQDANLGILGIARHYGADDNYKAAEQFYEQYLSNYPRDNSVFLLYIQAKLFGGDYAAAEKLLATYKMKFGTDDHYLTEQARFFAFTDRPKKALEIIEPLLEKSPKNSTLLKIKDYALQHGAVSSSPSQQPTNVAALLAPAISPSTPSIITPEQSKTPQAEVKSEPSQPPVSPILASARTFSQKAKYKEAAEAYKKYWQENPKDKIALIEYIRIELIDAKYDKANSLMNDYEKSFGKDDGYLTEKARLFALTNRSKEALSLTQSLLKKHPKDKTITEIQDYALKHPTVTPPKTAKTAGNKSEQEAQKNTPESRMLECAHELVKQNKLNKAVLVYCDFTQKYPMNKTAWIEYANVESWRSSYKSALRILECYCSLFGPTPEYLKTKARVLANAARPTPALAIICPFLMETPYDYDLNYTQVLGYYYNNQPVCMFNALNRLKCISTKDNQKDTKSLSDFVTTPYRSNVSLDLFRSRDTDTVDIVRSIVSARVFTNPCTKYFVNARGERVSADIGSGLEPLPVDGGNGLNLSSFAVGVTKRLNSKLELEGAVGAAHLSDGQSTPIYNLMANIKPNDTLLINWLEAYDYYDVSARALSFGVKQQLNQVSVAWEPALERYFLGRAFYSTYSDSNSQWYVGVAPKIGVLRAETLSLNFGLSGIWNGFSKQLNHGYYNPRFYQFYAVTADAYFNQSQNIGYGLSVGIGQQKDETFTDYKFAADVAVNAYFGIYQDWMLVLSAAGSNRGRAIANNAAANQTYQIYAIEATLTRRF